MNKWFNIYQEWNWERLSRHLFYWSAWTIFLSVVNAVMMPFWTYWQWLAFELSVLPVKIGFSYLVAYWLLPKYLYPRRYLAFLASYLFFFVVFSGLLIVVDINFVYPVILKQKIYNGFFADAVHWCIQLIHISGLVVAIKFLQNFRHEQARLFALQKEKIETELKYLKNQVRPHFLFNTLNSLYGMVLENHPNSAESIVTLSDMMSYMLYESEEEYVSLQRELQHIQDYIQMEKLRYQRKLLLEVEWPEAMPDLLIVPHLLLPFVENAFKHGPGKNPMQSSIYVSVQVSGNMLELCIQNTYKSDAIGEQGASGIGLETVQKRLQMRYPNRYQLRIEANELYEVYLQVELEQVPQHALNLA
ncbi:MAG: histidine kinase [Bacteroidota bacterium]